MNSCYVEFVCLTFFELGLCCEEEKTCETNIQFSKMLQDTYMHTIKLVYGLVLIQTFGHVHSAWQKTITSSSSHPGPYETQNAIDGNPRRDPRVCLCCAATLEGLNPWYQLDLGENHTIHRIHVEGRNDTPNYGQHFQGMQIYVKRVHDDIGVGEEIRITEATYNVYYELPIPKSTRYVSLVLYGVTRIFTICELTVFGDCTEGTFGGYCEGICYCEGEPCNTLTGECPSGKCLPGYYGTACDKECPDGAYGSGCTESCGNCFGAEVCNRENGICPGQCARGYQGNMCKHECDDGFYGQGCPNVCGRCHNGEPCNAVTGYCEHGCAAGYQTDPLCKTECTPGTFGVGCTETCGNCKGGITVCAKADGFCPAGCVAGYKGDICKTACDDRTYAENCNSNCGNCLNEAVCNRKTGVCGGGCSAGYTGDMCIDECPRDSYGIGCGSKCKNCVTCHHINGTCIGGCTAGFKTPLCREECDAGFYGPGCVLECGNCLNGEPCDKTLGYCIYGCSDGYQPDFLCKTEIQKEKAINNYLSLAISGWVCVGILLLTGVWMFVFMRKRMRANQKEVRAVSRLYEIPTARVNIVDDENPYSSTEINTLDRVYTNTESS